MKIGKIAQLTTNVTATERNAPRGPVMGMNMDTATLLARIVAIEKRLTDLAIRLYAVENRKPKGAR